MERKRIKAFFQPDFRGQNGRGLGIYAVEEERRKTCEKEWGCEDDREKEYYQDQCSQRLMECDHGVDPVWFTVTMKKRRKRELLEESEAEM